MPKDRCLIDSIDWSSMTHAYGSAVEVPGLLHKLRVRDLETSIRIYRELVGLVVHQGTRYETSAAVAPFLIEIVGDADAPYRFAACQVLACIAVGDESTWLSAIPDVPKDRQEVQRRAGLTVVELEEEQAAWVAAGTTAEIREGRARTAQRWDVRLLRDYERWAMDAYDAVRAGVPVYLAALRSSEQAVRLYAAFLLAWFPEDGDLIGPDLAWLIDNEQERNAIATACVAAGLCGQRGDQNLINALSGRRDGQDRGVRWPAVLGLARLEPRPSRALIEELYTYLLDSSSDIPYVPFLDGDMATLAAFTMRDLAPDAAPDRVGILAARLTRQDHPQDVFLLVRALLDAAFPDGPLPSGTPFQDVSEDQRNAVLALRHDPSMLDGAMISMLLGRYNLPAGREALHDWCSR